MLKNNKSLASQFFIFISILVSLTMVLSAYIQYRNETQIINQALHDRGTSIVELLASASIEPLLTFDDVSLDNYAEFTSKQKDIIFAAVVNKQKTPLTHYLNYENNYIKKLSLSNKSISIKPILEQLRINPDILFFEKQIEFEGKTLAYSWIGLDRLPYDRKSRNNLIKIIIITLFIGLFLSGAIYILFKRKVFGPIEILTKEAENIGNFNFEEKVKISGSGELVTLADAFDQMRLHLKETISSKNLVMNELSDLNDSLEERVHERTSELQILNTKIAHEAMHDPLTNLPNRVLINEQLQQTIKNAKRSNNSFAVFVMDLNNFKEVNDTLGHPEGDRLLIDVANRLQQSVRDTDTVGRLGGDEFAMVLPKINETNAISAAKKILKELSPSFALDNHSIKVGASIGISLYPQHGEDKAELIRTADIAMYEAKKNKSNVGLYHAEQDKYSPIRLSLMDYLHTALETDQLQLYYQPKISLHENKIISVEALIRWFHPEIGLIFPDQFIPLAENSGLIDDLSNWVIEHAMSQCREWQDQGINLQIAINLSARNLSNPDLPKFITKLFDKYNIHPGGIKAEITESAIMYNPEQVIKIMSDPDMQKLHFSIDDFGTGYSSLSYLKRLPVVEVKIDRSFVSDMVKNENDASIVKSVIDLVHNLGYTVVAEGVEDAETLKHLTDLGCDEVQGYYFSKPVPVNELIEQIQEIENNLEKRVPIK